MGTDLSERVAHPLGEQPEVEEGSTVGDTFAGRVHIEWDTAVPVTPLSRGISSGDVLIRPERHPACRRREAQPGSCSERENLTGDAKGKGASGSSREAESTDAPERGGLLRSSDEAGVMPVERRERVTDVGSGQPATGGT